MLERIIKKCPGCKIKTEHEISEGRKNKKLVCLECERKTFVKKDITNEELKKLPIYDITKVKKKY